MKIKCVLIENFRCLGEVDVDFAGITTFIGPNGAGKLSVLRRAIFGR
ncbi:MULTISPECIES: AAA family ATPase [unclassified Frondihabitans]